MLTVDVLPCVLVPDVVVEAMPSRSPLVVVVDEGAVVDWELGVVVVVVDGWFVLVVDDGG
ncbi:hypothetical protein GCM10009000_066020 [Halobacterium noricense]|uniref:Uncharacterized protein n=1 Tax=Haladaptatus pallidirubidus TaxID=1008152 RepID=A0AAV3UHB3_9EURY